MTDPTHPPPDSPEDRLRRAAEELGRVAERLGSASDALDRAGSGLTREALDRGGIPTGPGRTPAKPSPPTSEEREAARRRRPEGVVEWDAEPTEPTKPRRTAPPDAPPPASAPPGSSELPPVPPVRSPSGREVTDPVPPSRPPLPPPRDDTAPPPVPPIPPRPPRDTAPPPPPPRDRVPPPPADEDRDRIPRRPKSKLEKVWGAVKEPVSRAFNKSALGRATRRVRGAASRGGKIGKAAGIGKTAGMAAGGAAGVAVAGAAALKKFHDAILEATDAAVQAQRRYAEVSGSQAAVFAERDMKELVRDIKHGEETAGSTKQLIDAEQNRKDAFEPLKISIEKLENVMLAIGNNLIAETLGKVTEVGGEVVDAIREGAADLGRAVGLLGEEKKEPSVEDVLTRVLKDADDATRRAKEGMNRARDRAPRRGVARPGDGV